MFHVAAKKKEQNVNINVDGELFVDESKDAVIYFFLFRMPL